MVFPRGSGFAPGNLFAGVIVVELVVVPTAVPLLETGPGGNKVVVVGDASVFGAVALTLGIKLFGGATGMVPLLVNDAP